MQPSRRHTRLGKSTGLVPDYFTDTVHTINFRALKAQGVRYVVFDVDHTLTHYRGMEIDEATVQFIRQLKHERVVRQFYIASNSLRDVGPLAVQLGAAVIPTSHTKKKPSRRFYAYLLKTIGCRPEQAAMVGDKLLTDIWGGNRAGMITVLVDPIGPDRLLDKLVLRRFWGKQYLKRHGYRGKSRVK